MKGRHSRRTNRARKNDFIVTCVVVGIYLAISVAITRATVDGGLLMWSNSTDNVIMKSDGVHCESKGGSK